MNEKVPSKTGTLAAGGGADGYVQLSGTNPNDGFYPGGFAWLQKSDGSDSQYCVITDLKDTDKVGLRFIAESKDDPKLRDGTVRPGNMGRSSCAAFGIGSTLSMPSQVVEVIQPLFDPRPRANY